MSGPVSMAVFYVATWIVVGGAFFALGFVCGSERRR